MTEQINKMSQVENSSYEQQPNFWAAVWEALKGSHQDYTEGPLGRAILMLSIPMIMEMLMESIFAVADVFFVAKLGADAIAVVGITESLMTIIYTVAIGLSIGASAMVARRIGEKDREGAARVAVQTIVLGLIISVLLGIGGIICAPGLLNLMGASPAVIDSGVNYTKIMLGGNISVLMLFLINAIFRGAGDAAIAMRVLWFANLLNIILAPCLIFGIGPFPALGVAGAAVATTIGRGAGAIFAFSNLLRPKSRITITSQYLQIDQDVLMRLIKLSASGILQTFLAMASWIGLVRIVSGFGSDALAGYTIGIRVIVFALLPSWGLGSAAATMVGQALGAKKPERAEEAVWKASFYNMCFLGSVGLIFIIFARQIISLFTIDPAVLPHGIDCLRIVAAGFLFYAYGMVVEQSFNGAGDTRTPTLLNLFIFWLWEIPLAYLLSYNLKLGPQGVFIAITVAFSTLAVASVIIFRRGKWKAKVV